MTWTTPVTQVTSTLITAAIYNDQLINNMLHVGAMTGQDGTALSAMTAVALGPDVGDLKHAIRTASNAPAWLLCAGGTVGNASSSATVRANADMATIFAHLWDTVANAELAIQDSAGSPSSRGADAATDFAANKRMPLPDLRGTALVGLDNLGGSSANTITGGWADTIGDVGGSETHTLAAAEIPDNDTNANGTVTAATTIAITGHSGSASSAHNNIQPTMAVATLIYTGN